MDNTCHGLFWSDDCMTRDATEYPVVCSEATSGLGSATAIVVQLQFPTLLSEAQGHPHVKLFFVNEGRIYDAVFDTGSDISYALFETKVSSGYRFDPRTPRVGAPITLWYGFSGQVRAFESMGTIDETIRLCSSDDSNDFFFNEPRFATAAKIFALVPATPSWQLLIGPNTISHAIRYCSFSDRRIRWFERVIPSSFWVVSSTVSLESREVPPGLPQLFTEHIRLAIDTGGTDRVSISPALMDDVVAIIESFGPRRVRSEKPFPIFTNCTETLFRKIADGINLRFQLGDNAFSVSFKLGDYLTFVGVEYCALLWKIGLIPHTEDIVIGTQFLEKVVTVFDTIHNRVGFCTRGDIVN